MGQRIGIVGEPNSGKSYSRRTLRNIEKTFLISPSSKMTHIKGSKPVNFKFKSGDKEIYYRDLLEKASMKEVLKQVLLAKPKDFAHEGHFVVVKDLEELMLWTQIVDKLMPQVDTIIAPDFTHYISSIIGNKDFISRKSGGEAFQRFWELAGTALDAYFLNVDSLRHELIVVTEYHSIYDENIGLFKIFVPAGKMLEEKFLPDSYYDVLLYTKVLSAEEEPNRADRYKFVTKRIGKFNARDADLFEEELIPNDLQLVLDKYREYVGI